MNKKINDFIFRFLSSKKFNFLLLIGLGFYFLNSYSNFSQESIKDFNSPISQFIDYSKKAIKESNYNDLDSKVFFENKDEVNVKVIRVIDGDTLEAEYIMDSYLKSQKTSQEKQKLKIRLFGIDAPEKKQDFGEEAKNYLSSLVLGKEVRLKVENVDRYKRIVGTIYLKQNVLNPNSQIKMNYEKDINQDLVKNGYAWAYRQYSSNYIAEEADAKMFKIGLWKNPQAINPADFRKRKREQ